MKDNLNVDINLAKFPSITCEECGGKLFDPVVVLKQINKLVVGEAQDKIVPFTVFRCADCGEVNESGRKLLEN